jgi:hypothetical protein
MTQSLAELQRRFQRYVRQHGGVDVERDIVGDAIAPADARMNVYAHAYRLRLVEVLGNDFPALKATVGAPDFDRIGRAYIDAHPSADPSVRWFGRHLADFLRKEERERPALAELAAFEWAQGEAFDARDAAPLALEDVARIPPADWPAMRLPLHPSVRRVRTEWNVAAIAKAVDGGETPPAPAREPRATWLLWRRGLTVRWRVLAEDEAAAIDALAHGALFGDVCERLVEWVEPEAAAMHAASLLKRWLTDGLIAA